MQISSTFGQKQILSQPEIISGREGLPQAFVPNIVQDKQGFIWMGTRDGLCRYDGKNFKIFQPDPTGKPSISFTGLIKIAVDHKGKIWILAEQGTLDLFDPYTEKFVNISKTTFFRKSVKNNSVNDFFLDRDGRVWVIIFKIGIFCFDFQKEKVDALAFPNEENGYPGGNQIFSMAQDLSGKTWLGTAHQIFLYDEKKKEFELYLYNSVKTLVKGGATLRCLQVHPQTGNLLIGTSESFIILNQVSGKLREYALPNKLNIGYMLLVTDDKGNIYLSDQGILLKFSEKDGLKLFADFTSETWDARSLFVDQSQVLWMGTTGAGVRKYNLERDDFQTFKYNRDFLWDWLTVVFNIPKNKQPVYSKSTTGYHFRYTLDKKREQIWYSVGGDPSMIYRIRPEGGEISQYSLPELNLLPNEYVYPITEDPKGNIFVFYKYTFFQFSDSLNKFQPTTFKIDPLRTGQILQVTSDDRFFWLASKERGLFRYDRIDGTVKQYAHSPANINSLSSNTLFCLFSDPDDSNRLWIGTFGSGLCAFDKRTGKSRRISLKEGLPNNVIYSAIPDAFGQLWIGTNKGLSRMNRKTFKIRTYTVDDGLLSNEFNRFHYLQLPNGKIFMGGIDGYTAFDPAKLREDDYQPESELVSIQINNRLVTPGIGSPLGDMPINGVTEITLPHNQNFLTIDFATLQFNQIGKNQYRYRMQGVDDDWIESDEPRAVYTELRPGDYVLKVNSSNTSGIWSPRVRSLKIIINPPFWATWWSYLIYAASFLGILWWLFRLYANRLRMEQGMLLKEKETQQLKATDEIKTRFFSNISHEFRTPLTLIMTPADQLKMKLKDPDDLRKLTSINRNANHLLDLINQLLDLSKLEAGALPVTEVRGDLSAFIHETFRLFEQQSEDRGINLVFENFDVTGEYYFDADKIEKIIRNLVFNALKFTPKEGSVRLSIGAKEGGILQIVIKDTGTGITAEKLSKIFDRFYQGDSSPTRPQEGTGIGLSLVKEIVDLLKGKIEVASEPGLGTMFTILIPVRSVGDQPRVEHARDILPTESPNEVATDEQIQVLIVEDNVELAHYIAESLPDFYQITHAYNGLSGLEKATENLPNLVISDVLMPGMDGYTLCGKLKNDIRTSHIPVMMLTAKSSLEDRLQGLENHADDYLAKPFQVRELQLRVRNLLQTQKRQRDRIKSDLSTLHREPDLPPVAVQDPFLVNLYHLIDIHIDDSTFGVEQLSERMGISRIHLYRKIKTLTGFTATELLRNYRLKHALSYLNSGYSIAEAGNMVGFDTPSYFTKCFRELYDLTPTEFLSKN